MCLSLSVTLLALACLFDVCHAFANCGKKGGCENLQGGDQNRPILSGGQDHVDVDGRCKYGHASVEGKCQSGVDCGYTLFVCACVDKETARAQHNEKALWFLLGGIACCIIGSGLAVGCFVAEQQKQARKRLTSVVPQSGKELPTTVHGFSDLFGTSSKSRQDSKSEESRKTEIDSCGLLIIGALAAVVVLGIILIIISVSLDRDKYFNECD